MTEETRMHTFQTPQPIHLRVELYVGRVEIRADETDETTVELEPHDSTAEELVSRARVEQVGDEIRVLVPRTRGGGLFGRKGEITGRIRVPQHSSINVETASADVETHGRLGDADVSTGSGEIRVNEADDTRVRSGSGDIVVDHVHGSLEAKGGSSDLTVGDIMKDATITTGSGDVEISNAHGHLRVKTGSGDVVVEEVRKSIDALAGSGDLVIKRVEQGRVKAKTGSGDVLLGIADGTAAYLDVMAASGEVHSKLNSTEAPTDDEQTVDVSIMTGSGDVVLQRA
jgi:DUF4097 and DUF4098 domain-containing protein YvlB